MVALACRTAREDLALACVRTGRSRRLRAAHRPPFPTTPAQAAPAPVTERSPPSPNRFVIQYITNLRQAGQFNRKEPRTSRIERIKADAGGFIRWGSTLNEAVASNASSIDCAPGNPCCRRIRSFNCWETATHHLRIRWGTVSSVHGRNRGGRPRRGCIVPAQLPITRTALKNRRTKPTRPQQPRKPRISCRSHFVSSQFDFGKSLR